MIDTNTFSPDALDALLADLPGDHRAAVQKAIGGQPAAAKFLSLKPEDVVSPHYANSAKAGTVAGWLNAPHTKHRAAVLATAVAAWLDAQTPADLAILRQKKAALEGLAAFARQVRGAGGQALDEAMKRLGLAAI